MMKNIFTILSIFFLINCFNFSELRAEMRNTIVAKVGNSLISSVDIQNEIMTNLFLRKEEVLLSMSSLLSMSVIELVMIYDMRLMQLRYQMS